MPQTIEIDGSYGEGGGQILRSALSLSILTGKPFHIQKIRANRKNPGLAAQHVSAIQSAMKISGSESEGAKVDSQKLTFYPGKAKAGSYTFSVPTAGAMPLVLQAVYLPLALTGEKSSLVFEGGTHVTTSPCYEYVAHVWGKTLAQLGLGMSFHLERAGYYPRGQGRFTVEISPTAHLKPYTLEERSPLTSLEIHAILSMLPSHIAEREIDTVKRLLRDLVPISITHTMREYPAANPGNVLFLLARFEKSYAGFTSLGERGKPAEKVASELAREFREFWKTSAPLELHLADQLLLPLAFSSEASCYRIAAVTEHLLTNAYILGLFLENLKIEIQGTLGKPGRVVVKPK